MCTQNQFTVQMFMKPVYSTDIHTEQLNRVEPKQLLDLQSAGSSPNLTDTKSSARAAIRIL